MEHVSTENLMVVAAGLALASLIPALFPRLPVPGVVLEIIFGAVAGPQILGWVHPGTVMDFVAEFGLGTLFFAAGFEMEPRMLRGAPIRNAALGWLMSAALALLLASSLTALHLARGASFTALAMATTAIGALMPMLRDARLLGPPYGPFVLAGGAMGEAGPVVLLSLILAKGRAPLQSLIMVAFAALSVAAVYGASRISGGYLARVVERTMRTSGQLPMRLAIVLLLCLAILSRELDIDMVLGAFVAGAIVRSALSEEHRAHLALRLDGVGNAFAIPVFFIASGARLDVAALFASSAALAMVPAFAILMLAVRGLPVLLLYRRALPSRQRLALACHLGTQISLVVPITAIAVRQGAMPGAQGAAMVGAAIVTTLLYPALAARLVGDQSVAAPQARHDAFTSLPSG